LKQRVFSFDGGELRALALEAPGPLRWAAWNRMDCSALLVGDHGSVFEYREGVFGPIKSGTTENLRCVEFRQNGGAAYACGNGGTVVRIEGGAVSKLRSEGRDNLRRLAWSIGGARALVVGNNGAAYILDPSDELSKVPGAETHLRSVAWYSDDDLALVTGNCFRDSIGSLSPSPNLFELKDDVLNEVTNFEESRADLTSSSWRPHGSDCLVAGFDQTWHTPVLFSYAPGRLTALEWVGENIFPTACSWNPTGTYALVGTSPLTGEEGPASLWRYEFGGGVTKLADLQGFGVSCIAWKDEDLALIACSRSVRAYSA
jgi:hypothetical protein